MERDRRLEELRSGVVGAPDRCGDVRRGKRPYRAGDNYRVDRGRSRVMNVNLTVKLETAEERAEMRRRWEADMATWNAETKRKREACGLGPYERGEITYWQFIKKAWSQ